MAGGKGKDTFRAESISLLCFLRCRDLWRLCSPWQEDGEDLDGTRSFSGFAKLGGGKGPCGRSDRHSSDVAGQGVLLGRGTLTPHLAADAELFGEEKRGIGMGISVSELREVPQRHVPWVTCRGHPQIAPRGPGPQPQVGKGRLLPRSLS